MREIQDHADAVITPDPGEIFKRITDIEWLPEWNSAIEQVIERPAAVTTGATWTVEMHPNRPVRWKSVSTLQELDEEALRFSYRTLNADGNPSYSLWSWELTPTGSGVHVSVHWDVYLETLDRRHFRRADSPARLRKEVAASLPKLATLVGAPGV